MFRCCAVVAAPDLAPPTSGSNLLQPRQKRVAPLWNSGAVQRFRKSDSELGFGVDRDSARCGHPEAGEIHLEGAGQVEESGSKRFALLSALRLFIL